MTRLIMLAVVAMMIVVLSQAAEDIGGADVIAIREVQQEIIDAYNNQDLDLLLSYYHRDVGYLVPSRPYVEGWGAVRAMYDETFTRFQSTNTCGYLQATTQEVVVSEDWAWARGESKFVISTCGSMPDFPPDQEPGSKHMSIYKKENGKWLRYRQIRNGNTPEMNI